MRRLPLSLLAGLSMLSTVPARALDVSVVEQNGNVTITGDDLPDSLLIEAPVPGFVVVTGRFTGPFSLWPTRVNGSLSPLLVEVPGDLTINLRGGDDDLVIRDHYSFEAAGADLNISMGSGNDDLRCDDLAVSGEINVHMGSGFDVCEAFELISLDISFVQSQGTGFFNLYGFNTQEFLLSTGASYDKAYLGAIVTNRACVFMGSGNDVLFPGILDLPFSGSILDGGTGDRDGVGRVPWRFFGNKRNFERHNIGTLFE